MTKLIRFDEDHFGYLIDQELSDDETQRLIEAWRSAYQDKRLIVMMADEFVDLTGQYEIVQIADEVAK